MYRYVYVFIFENSIFFKRYYSVISLICRYFVDLLLRKSNYIIIYLCFDFYEFSWNMKDEDILSIIVYVGIIIYVYVIYV